MATLDLAGIITRVCTDLRQRFAALSHSHAASDISSGTLDAARIPNLAASKITSGTLAIGRVPTGTTSSTVAQGNHVHGNITSGGDITASATIASGDRLVINDESASKVTNSSITFGTSTTTFLANDGTWQTPSGGGASSVAWDDVTDKPFDDESDTVQLSGYISSAKFNSSNGGSLRRLLSVGDVLSITVYGATGSATITTITEDQFGVNLYATCSGEISSFRIIYDSIVEIASSSFPSSYVSSVSATFVRSASGRLLPTAMPVASVTALGGIKMLMVDISLNNGTYYMWKTAQEIYDALLAGWSILFHFDTTNGVYTTLGSFSANEKYLVLNSSSDRYTFTSMSGHPTSTPSSA